MLENGALFDAVIPEPGFCLKTKDEKENKVFLNICVSDKIPEPPPISDDRLIELLESDRSNEYRIPMSLGEPHAEIDKNGAACTAYDVMVGIQFFNNLEQKRILMTFFLSVLLEGLESKFEIHLSRDWKILKNRKSLGMLQKQNVRKVSKPHIEEIGCSVQISEIDDVPDVERINSTQPSYIIKKEPPTGRTEYLTALIELPNVKSANSMSVSIGEDRIILETQTNAYYLDVFLPFDIVQEEARSEFNKRTKVLTLTMPVQNPISS